MIFFRASGRSATAETDDHVTTGSVGIPVDVELSDEFDGLAATMVFRAGDEYADVALGFENSVSVPPQCLYKAGSTLRIGVYAEDGNRNVVIPTVWTSVCTIRQGAERSGVDPAEPTPSWAAQVQQWAEDAHDTAEHLAEQVDGWQEEIETAVTDAENVNATASKTGTTATVTVTDRTGTAHSVEIHDGAEGYSPSARVDRVEGGVEVTVTDKSGSTTAMLYDANLTEGSVTTDNLATGSVTLDKLAGEVVRLEWVADGDDRRLAVVYENE